MNNNSTNHMGVKKIFKRIISIMTIIVVLVIGIFIGGWLNEKHGLFSKDNEEVIHTYQVMEKMKELDELSTYSYEYTNHTETDGDVRTIFNLIKIPGTKNVVDFTYSGIIKVGYDISDIKATVDNKNKKISITLPEAKVIDNYIYLDNLECNNTNNILNPIDMDDYNKYFEGIEDKELKTAEDNEIYVKAEEQLKKLIINYLSEFEYDVEILK